MNEPRDATVLEELPREMARVRDEVMPAYLAIGQAGTFALIQMRVELDRAAEALATQNVPKMIRVLAALRQFHA